MAVTIVNPVGYHMIVDITVWAPRDMFPIRNFSFRRKLYEFMIGKVIEP
jgi:hypothetical protein